MLRYLCIFITNNSKNLFHLNDPIGKLYAAIHSIISNCGVNKELVIESLKSGGHHKHAFHTLCKKCLCT